MFDKIFDSKSKGNTPGLILKMLRVNQLTNVYKFKTIYKICVKMVGF